MTPPEPDRPPPDEPNEHPIRCSGCEWTIDARPVPERCRECGAALTEDAEIERFLQ